MCIDLLTNPAVIGGLVGAIASAVFALVTSWYKFNKRKKEHYHSYNLKFFIQLKYLRISKTNI